MADNKIEVIVSVEAPGSAYHNQEWISFDVEGDTGSDVFIHVDPIAEQTETVCIGEPDRDVSYLVTHVPLDGLDALIAKLQAAKEWRDQQRSGKKE